MKKGSSNYSGFGKTTHYDSKGKKAGYSQYSGFGKTNHYDAKGKKIGSSYNSGFGTTTHYDAKGKQVGKTYGSNTGTSTHYNAKGKQVGKSYNTKYSSTHYSGNDGCYVATCVYGSYDCPEVWTLRRFRDYYLKKSTLGKLFIKAYYAISPKIVLCFGKNKYFRAFWKNILDKFVATLKNKGYSEQPYNDN